MEHWWNYTDKREMSMELWWNDTGRGKLSVSIGGMILTGKN
jgi:hypothetical protein